MNNVLNLGAGVQSSTMSLMAANGELEPMPDFAVFADTKAEPPSVYRWLDWLEKQLPFPVHRVSAGDLREAALKKKVTADGRVFPQTAVPVFTLNEDGSAGKVMYRDCTRDYKIRPIHKFIRKQCGVKRGQKHISVMQWMGISLDEVQRMRTSRDAWSELRYPLIEKRMTRRHCLQWMESKGYSSPPRSACTFCPFHSNKEWRRLQTEEPEAFAEAVDFEEKLTAMKAESDKFLSRPFLHPKLVPLSQIDFRSDVERGQMTLWDDECEGMCGV